MADYAYVYVHVDDATPDNRLAEDPLYKQGLSQLQRGLWLQAAHTIADLDRRYPGSAELGEIRQQLSLRLSAELTWNPKRVRSLVHIPAVKALLIANLALYALLCVFSLLARYAGLI